MVVVSLSWIQGANEPHLFPYHRVLATLRKTPGFHFTWKVKQLDYFLGPRLLPLFFIVIYLFMLFFGGGLLILGLFIFS